MEKISQILNFSRSPRASTFDGRDSRVWRAHTVPDRTFSRVQTWWSMIENEVVCNLLGVGKAGWPFGKDSVHDKDWPEPRVHEQLWAKTSISMEAPWASITTIIGLVSGVMNTGRVQQANLEEDDNAAESSGPYVPVAAAGAHQKTPRVAMPTQWSRWDIGSLDTKTPRRTLVRQHKYDPNPNPNPNTTMWSIWIRNSESRTLHLTSLGTVDLPGTKGYSGPFWS